MTTGGGGRGRIVVVGVGNPYRRDDGVGPAVVDRLRAWGSLLPEVTLAVTDGEPTRLLDLWDGVELTIVVDATKGPPEAETSPGRIHELALDRIPADKGSASSHGVAFGAVVELALALGRMPGRLVVFAVEGADFRFGSGLTPPVARAADDVAARIGAILAERAGGTRGRSG
jgi:hydrogenase maturation protease